MSLESAFEIGRLFDPINRMAATLVASQKDLFIRLPALRAYWPMSAANYLGQAVDHSNASVNLQRSGAPTYGFDGNAYVQLGIANDFLFDLIGELDFTGTEAWIDSGIQGLTVGCWVKVQTTPSTDSGLISKDAANPERGFLLWQSTTNIPGFQVSGAGITVIAVTGSTISLDTWHFIVGRFTPSTELAVFVDGDKAVYTTSIPSSVNISTQNFEVGRFLNDNNRIIEGRARDVFICAAALPDALIEEVRVTSLP